MLDFAKDPSGVSVLIETLEMVESGRSNLRTGWRRWLEWCREHGFGPLEGRGPELLGFLQGDHAGNAVICVLKAVSFGYEKSRVALSDLGQWRCGGSAVSRTWATVLCRTTVRGLRGC